MNPNYTQDVFIRAKYSVKHTVSLSDTQQEDDTLESQLESQDTHFFLLTWHQVRTHSPTLAGQRWAASGNSSSFQKFTRESGHTFLSPDLAPG